MYTISFAFALLYFKQIAQTYNILIIEDDPYYFLQFKVSIANGSIRLEAINFIQSF